MSTNYLRGSEWRKWDLHVHTASSYDYKYKGDDADNLLANSWQDNQLAAVAITDHFLIDIERIKNLRKLAPDITIFPGVELRTDKGATNLHIILIFPETTDLNKLSNAFQVTMLDQNSKANESNETIYWAFEDIVDFAKKYKGLISLHTGAKTNGIDDVITNAMPVNMAIKKEIASLTDIFEIGIINDIKDYEKNVFPNIGRKPLILCSDNHDPRDYKFKDILWIKADPTFNGLIQVVNHPEERIFIGDIPTKLNKSIKNKRLYIDYLIVNRIENPMHKSSHWFDINLPINNGLTIIIGNKGSGKSAFSDIIGHFCKSKSMNDASFLNDTRFRKLPENLSKDYIGNLKWLDGESSEVIDLNTINYDITNQSAQYLPQRYIERVCTSLDDYFQQEINNVIFSYIDSTEIGYAKSLDELINNKTRIHVNNINLIQNNLDLINKEIVDLENKLTTEYEKEICNTLNKYKIDLERHLKNKPKNIEEPISSLDKEDVEGLKELNDSIKKLNNEINITSDKLMETNVLIEDLNYMKSRITSIIREIKEVNLTLDEEFHKFGFEQDQLKITYNAPLQVIENKLSYLESNRSNLMKILDNSDSADLNVSLYMQLNKLVQNKEDIISKSNAIEKAYHKYLQDLEEWNMEVKVIKQFINNYEFDLNQIHKVLPTKYELKRKNRLVIVKEIFEEKKSIANIYSKIYEPIEKKLKLILSNIDNNIDFNVNIVLSDNDIATNLLNYINHSYAGIFNGKLESLNAMTKYLGATNFDDLNSIYNLLEQVLVCVDEDPDISSKKIKNKIDFYNLLTGLSYIDVKYTLKLNERTLEELSPGERGIVLLVFYLALSKEDIPLIIDQPEDNLDNQSVYDQLVPCICEAKKRRQVIIVTHNPNIAIACDAEQIICCSISKTNNKISYLSGSIENETIKSKIIDILEGTTPAFNLRKRKYKIT